MGQIECASCGRTISSDSVTCKYCGEPVKKDVPVETTLGKTVTCPQCEKTIKAGLDVCPYCGFERKVARKAAARPKAQAGQPDVIVPRKKPAPEPSAPIPRPPTPEPPRPKEPRTRTPEPPTKIDQERIDAASRATSTTDLPPPPGLDAALLPEKPAGLAADKIHVFLRGLQLAVKPMDYPTLIANIRARKVKANDFIYDSEAKAWRTLADLFNLPEVE